MIHDTKNVGKPTVLTCRFPTFYGCLLQPQERIDREAANMYYKFLVNIHDEISSNFKGLAKHDPNKWRHFISVNETLDQLEESVVELDFE